MSDTRNISTLFSARLIAAAGRAGLSEAVLWRELGVQPEGGEFPFVSEVKHLELWESIMRRLDDPGFPIAYAEQLSIDAYGVLGLACKTARDMGQALATLERYLPVYADAVGAKRIQRGPRVSLVFERPGTPSLGWRCSLESALAELLGAMRAVAGRTIVPEAVTLSFPAPRDLKRHAAYFGVRPTFGAAECAMVFDARVLSLPLLRADHGLFVHLERELSRLEVARQGERRLDIAERVRVEVLRLLPRAARLGNVARALALSERTLQRHLAGEGVRFEEVVDHARRELAEALLPDASRSIAEVAAATGFSEVASFSRAFRRWTGRSPSALRRP
jgi:AraC-like DNA-binding protein